MKRFAFIQMLWYLCSFIGLSCYFIHSMLGYFYDTNETKNFPLKDRVGLQNRVEVFVLLGRWCNELWYSKYSAGGKLGLGKPTIYNAWAQPDVLYPFGPYLLPIPYDSTGYLNLEYDIHWNISCSEYDALIPCSHYYKTIPFVFIENENKHLLRIGNEVKQIFEC